jgi:putative phosphoesterase
MKKIGIISDTHGGLCPDVFKYFEDVDAILHAGDIGTEEVLIELEAIAPVYAVRGNVDFFQAAKNLPRKRIETFESVRFGLIHGDIFPRTTLVEQLIPYFADDHVQAIVFGHTHEKFIRQVGSVYLLNPGASNPHQAKSCHSVLVVMVDSGKIVKIVDMSLQPTKMDDFFPDWDEI